MKKGYYCSYLAMICAASLGLTGCTFLQPTGITPRSFILTPIAVAEVSAPPVSTPISVGIGYVKMPSYLLKKTMAMRRDSNEIVYLETMQWAERLDLGLQRVLASNLGVLLPADRIRASNWRSDEVSAVVLVSVEQFDVDVNGKCALVAAWRVQSSNGEKPVAKGRFSKTRDGSRPDDDPQGAVNTMSALAADFCHELARAIQP